jgi:hypothetical protein
MQAEGGAHHGGINGDGKGWRGGSASREEGTAATFYRRRELERRCVHVKKFPGPRYGHKMAATCGLYGGVGIGRPARRLERVARAGWARKAVDAPSITSALATWSPRDRRSQQGTGGCAQSVGGEAGVATARDVARGRERLAPADCSI